MVEATGKQKAGIAGVVAAIAAVTGLYTAVHGTHTTTTAENKTPIVVNRPHDANGSPLPVTVSKLPNGTPLVIVGAGAPHPCHYRKRGTDPLQVLQDKACTPGGVDPNVTQANIHQTICDPNWKDSRPPSSVTAKIKVQSLMDYGLQQSDAASTELDHLIPVRAGGSSDPKNLWVEPNYPKAPNPYVHNPKDAVELQVYNAICNGKVTLAAAQHAMATDWTTARKTLHI